MTPEKLVEKMAKCLANVEPSPLALQTSRNMLRIVLSAIQRGEIVEIDYPDSDSVIVLQPEFQKFMEEK